MIKQRLAELIETLGVIKKEFAESIGVSTGNLADWLNGKTEPSAKALSRIFEQYQVNLNWLVSGNGPMFLDAGKVADRQAAYRKKRKSGSDPVAQLQERVDQIEKEVRELREKK